MRESASNHEFNAFYHGSPGFFRAGIVFPQSPRYHRAQSGHEIDAARLIHLSLFSFSLSPSLRLSISIQCRQPAVAGPIALLDAISRENTETASRRWGVSNIVDRRAWCQQMIDWTIAISLRHEPSHRQDCATIDRPFIKYAPATNRTPVCT